jgi:Protein of unknown function (DUF3168)
VLKTALWDTHKAIFSRLSGDTALSQKVTGVYDKVPENTPFPYVVIGSPNPSPLETKSSYGENIPWVLHCYSTYNGKKEVYEILNLMLQALTKERWTIEGFNLLKFNIEPNMQVLEPAQEGFPYQGILRVRFHINN